MQRLKPLEHEFTSGFAKAQPGAKRWNKVRWARCMLQVDAYLKVKREDDELSGTILMTAKRRATARSQNTIHTSW